MKTRIGIAIFVSIACFGCAFTLSQAGAEKEAPLPEGTPTARPTGPEWLDLLSAENASFWKNVSDDKADIFEIKDGVFHIFGGDHSRYIAFEKEAFSDFTMHVEFKVSHNANSGVFFRTDPKNPVQGGMEIQVFDDYHEQPNKNSSGALYDIATPMFNLSRPTGEWNSYDITCKDSHLQVVVNGWKVLDLDLSIMKEPIGKFATPLAQLPQTGHIVLQDHCDEVWYRCVMIKKL